VYKNQEDYPDPTAGATYSAMTCTVRKQVRADFSRTCKGCNHVVDESAGKGKMWAKCTAPGPHQGRVVGNGQFPPYVPAWCPLM